MQLDLKSPKTIYLNVLGEVDSILNMLGSSRSNDDVSREKASASKILRGIQKDIKDNITKYKNDSEWDIFTIAFYGETGAGKSTIIETLRIMLAEQSKLSDQQRFSDIQKRHNLTNENFATFHESISKEDVLISELQQELDDIARHHDEQASTLKKEISHLNIIIKEKNKTTPFWQKLLGFFITSPEQKKIKRAKTSLKSIEAETPKKIKLKKLQQLQARQRKAVFEKKCKHFEGKLKKLEKYADGAIIGDGRSDYTTETKKYIFSTGNHKFHLLDVPGIEGKESKVEKSILSAVRQAHAVFYVTGKATPPQKGEEGKKGTLEKIKEHLDAQTEVWAIYNKRITNPIQLVENKLISNDVSESLKNLNKILKEQLGENYRNVIHLSALPAFLAVAKCITLNSRHTKSRLKYLSSFTQHELLSRSNMLQLSERLTGELLNNSKEKIICSNLNKANQIVKNAIDKITQIKDENLLPFKQQLEETAKYSGLELDSAVRGLEKRLELEGESAINRFEKNVRKTVYSRIEENISNDDFKNALEIVIQQEKENLERDLPNKIDQQLKKFNEDISRVIERFQYFSKELMETYSNIKGVDLGNKFDVKINIDNGIKLKNLIASLAIGVFLFWNPVGWVELALSLVTLIVSIGKAIMGFFDSDYKMAQQRKSTDENLNAITNQMRLERRDSLKNSFPKLEIKIEDLKNELLTPAKQIAEILEILSKSESNLTQLSYKINNQLSSNEKNIRHF